MESAGQYRLWNLTVLDPARRTVGRCGNLRLQSCSRRCVRRGHCTDAERDIHPNRYREHRERRTGPNDHRCQPGSPQPLLGSAARYRVWYSSSSTQLDTTADVPGTFAYIPSAGTVLSLGDGQTLSATFTPTDTTDYTSGQVQTTLNVIPATPGTSPDYTESNLPDWAIGPVHALRRQSRSSLHRVRLRVCGRLQPRSPRTERPVPDAVPRRKMPRASRLSAMPRAPTAIISPATPAIP